MKNNVNNENRQVFLMGILVNVEPDEAQPCIGKTPPSSQEHLSGQLSLVQSLEKGPPKMPKRVEIQRTSSRENQSWLRVTSGHTFDISLLFLSVLFRQRVQDRSFMIKNRAPFRKCFKVLKKTNPSLLIGKHYHHCLEEAQVGRVDSGPQTTLVESAGTHMN